jgi:hypothetical protein
VYSDNEEGGQGTESQKDLARFANEGSRRRREEESVSSYGSVFKLSVAYRDAEEPQRQHGPENNAVWLV